MEAVIKDSVDDMRLHLIGFVQGDVMGLLISINKNDTVKFLLEQILESAEIRTGNSDQYHLMFKDRPMRLDARIQDTSMKTLERIDLIKLRDLNAEFTT